MEGSLDLLLLFLRERLQLRHNGQNTKHHALNTDRCTFVSVNNPKHELSYLSYTKAIGSLCPSGLQASSFFCFFLLFLTRSLSASVGFFSLKYQVMHITYFQYISNEPCWKQRSGTYVLESVIVDKCKSRTLRVNWVVLFPVLISASSEGRSGSASVTQPNSHPATDN